MLLGYFASLASLLFLFTLILVYIFAASSTLLQDAVTVLLFSLFRQLYICLLLHMGAAQFSLATALISSCYFCRSQ